MTPAKQWLLTALSEEASELPLTALREEFEKQKIGHLETLKRALSALKAEGVIFTRKDGKYTYVSLVSPLSAIGNREHPLLTTPPLFCVPYAVSDEGQPMRA